MAFRNLSLLKMRYFFQYFVILVTVNFIEGSFRCDYKYNAVAKGWFKHFFVPANWFDARLRCAMEGATLASPTTPEIAAEMTQYITANRPEIEGESAGYVINNFPKTTSEIFTGIHATFSRGDYYTIEGTPLSELHMPWAENEPDNVDDKESCITINGGGELADLACEETRPYICYRSGNAEVKNTKCGTIDPDYQLNTKTNSCYKFHSVPRNFSRAYLVCAAEGGHLAIINSKTEATVLKELFAKNPAKKMVGNFWKDVAFVGFHDWNESMEWRTIHGQTLSEAGYSKFSSGEPNNASPGENCGAIYRSGQLNDLWCDRPAPFICEKNPEFPAICKA